MRIELEDLIFRRDRDRHRDKNRQARAYTEEEQRPQKDRGGL